MTNTTLTMKTSAFELQTCGRCAGSGKYSYNSVDGDRCYGCSGTGVVLTKRGKAAKAEMERLQMRPTQDVQVGDHVVVTLWPYADKWRRVEAIRRDADNLILTFIVKGERHDYHTWASGALRCVRTEAERLETVAKALAYQDTLTKLGKPSKAKAAA